MINKTITTLLTKEIQFFLAAADRPEFLMYFCTEQIGHSVASGSPAL